MNTMERVRQEMRRFEASLPRLKPLYADRWVVFRDGDVARRAAGIPPRYTQLESA
jgi:hypothetical protein